MSPFLPSELAPNPRCVAGWACRSAKPHSLLAPPFGVGVAVGVAVGVGVRVIDGVGVGVARMIEGVGVAVGFGFFAVTGSAGALPGTRTMKPDSAAARISV